jgi:hypothetical protein
MEYDDDEGVKTQQEVESSVLGEHGSDTYNGSDTEEDEDEEEDEEDDENDDDDYDDKDSNSYRAYEYRDEEDDDNDDEEDYNDRYKGNNLYRTSTQYHDDSPEEDESEEEGVSLDQDSSDEESSDSEDDSVKANLQEIKRKEHDKAVHAMKLSIKTNSAINPPNSNRNYPPTSPPKPPRDSDFPIGTVPYTYTTAPSPRKSPVSG